MTPSTNGTQGLTADMVIMDEASTAGTITNETVDGMVANMVEDKVVAPNPKLQNGRRIIGPTKMKLLMKIQTECAKLGRQGINASYCLHKMTDWTGPISTNTKKMSGIIGQLRSFRD